MTNEQIQIQIQTIGISEAAFIAATEEQRIEWAKANTTAGFGLCVSAIKWLIYRRCDVGEYVPVFDAVARVGDGPTRDGYVYRLIPDWQPGVNRWVFNPIMMTVDWTHDKTIKTGWLEVTAEYAEYLRDKPDGEWELRKVEIGDKFFGRTGFEVEADATYADRGLIDLGYRWCKPRKAAPDPPRYVVKSSDGIKYVWDSKGRYAVCHGAQMQDLWRIAKAMNAIEASKGASKDSEK